MCADLSILVRHPRKFLIAPRWMAVVLLVSSIGSLRAEKLVTVRTTADSAYVQRRAANNPPKVETYVFAKGQFFAGTTYDAILTSLPFQKLAETLAYDLQQQNYLPTKDVKAADLVIVVHWGATMPNDQAAAMMAFNLDTMRDASNAIGDARALEAADSSGISSALGVAAAAEAAFRFAGQEAASMYARDDVASASNAELLGFKSAIAEENKQLFSSPMSQTLRTMVDEERYFIVMEAYDAQRMRAGKKQRLWVSRMSIRSAGVNFRIGLDRMSNAAAKFNGTKSPGLVFEYKKERKGSVQVGEFEVLGNTP